MKRKRCRKWFNNSGKAKRAKNGKQVLRSGMKGVLLTCDNGLVNRCLAEALQLFKEYTAVDCDSSATVSNYVNLESAVLYDAIDQCVNSLTVEKDALYAVETGVKNCPFVSCPVDADPVKLVNKIMEDVRNGVRASNRLIQRLLPVEITCHADVDSISDFAGKLIRLHFSTDAAITAEESSYAIVYRARNNNCLSKEAIYDRINEQIRLNNNKFKVVLENPKHCILVNTLKDVCCLSVVQNYYDYKKFNWNQIQLSNRLKEEEKKTE
ncbi:THUMP domain-containing protein 1 [Trichinella nativa]|uniref:THUMP domain protein n=1 Tax=Trichinella nativa TaxID=6335 RepID=A0A0V1LMS1_9BILA|nr:THUMP domain-containing protein 1 [Trichinella nativa]OUC44175.1 THUMP domain protein [Trichinella nativa]